MVSLFRFLSAGGDKGYPYFQCLNKNNRFTWTHECEDAFLKLKEYLTSPPVLCKPLPGTPPSSLFCSYWSGNQLGHHAGTRSGSKAYLLREQGATRVGGVISSHREGDLNSDICGSATVPLFSEFHYDSDDWSPNSQSPLEARYSRSDGALGSQAVWVWHTIRTHGAYQGPGRQWWFSMGPLGGWIFQPAR